MQLIGMLDSPYVRRVAVSLRLMGVGFEHQAVSVFRTFEQFHRINPVVKAPTLVCDDGTVLMDSTLILDYVETCLAPAKSLMPVAPAGRQRALRLIGLALAACEKSVQIVYERQLRPAEKQHQPWLERVEGQVLAAYGELEREFERAPLAASAEGIDQAGVSVAVAWRFTQLMLPDVVKAADFPLLQAFAQQAEQLPAFIDTPPL
ncbi:glutathione S-transferase [Pseudogulbenkiania subflava]|uniref:Glutathione S-transferase n=1 Tax=Pseudogulbenkiania subflava DSM 22618 TaxID=1123014 RepID=A0A1Y6BFV6_9NEIS|nr:glutathione S-transferase [Pseudogulbenkiania subflava]SME99376.1 Glutathione S-transferase [Pseudogulbenkiania subflava DSM 22618]